MADYLRDPEEIYRLSLARIRREVDLTCIPADLTGLALRLVHACAMPEIVADLAFSPTAGAAGRKALKAGAPILVDANMVAQGITRLAAGNDVVCKVGDPEVPALARRLETTRSAAAVELWRPRLEGAVVAIGNAPTALFRLLELIAGGAGRPALILGFPLGFVGAAEAKAALAEDSHGVPFITLKGRRGGSALAAAAVNALAENGFTDGGPAGGGGTQEEPRRGAP
ncbi:MAG: precorrin-8X methylmutase [Proteobacteria bacterium]|nr:precorrin-8X methylmutase [Pseudomonadota bacterium]